MALFPTVLGAVVVHVQSATQRLVFIVVVVAVFEISPKSESLQLYKFIKPLSLVLQVDSGGTQLASAS
jgi:hypothetical protein